jgi:hypothetical protein
MTYANVDLVPLMRIHLDVLSSLLPLGVQRCPQERIRLDCEAGMAIEAQGLSS